MNLTFFSKEISQVIYNDYDLHEKGSKTAQATPESLYDFKEEQPVFEGLGD